MNLGGAVRINKCGLLFIAAVGFIIIFYAYGRNGSNNGGGGGGVNSNDLSASAVLVSPGVSSPSDKVSLRELVSAAIDVAKKGGLQVVEVRKSAPILDETVKGKTKEGVKDSATAGDFRSHRVMYYSLRKTFPLVKVISEEHDPTADVGDVTLASKTNEEVEQHMKGDELVPADDVTVWIDPLDATKEYTENLLHYVTTMVGIAVKGKPVVGVIHRPFQEETYWAVLNHGHSPNLQPSGSQPEEKKLSESSPFRIIVSLSHKGDVKEKTEAVLGPQVPVKLIEAAGAGYKVLEVVKGNADVYLHVTAIKKWDLCAGNAILDALAGKMTTVDGEFIDYSGHTEALNSKGILAYLHETELVGKLKKIEMPVANSLYNTFL